VQRAKLFFPYPEATADAIARALAPESAIAEVPKTRAVISRTEDGVSIDITADDLASLRAAVNSYLRWVEAASKSATLGRG
jgi:tRNA threonylcarbamoyladenosine modification (KEOPS) complex  Pcc1 subunit